MNKTNELPEKQGLDAPLVSNSTYRCGWCGQPTDEDGNPLSIEECEKLTEEQLNNAEMVHGDCCRAEQMYNANSMRVIRDMAIDAGDMSLEGEYI